MGISQLGRSWRFKFRAVKGEDLVSDGFVLLRFIWTSD